MCDHSNESYCMLPCGAGNSVLYKVALTFKSVDKTVV